MQKQFAKKLRKEKTKPEDILWYRLRNRRFYGLKFRRQEPIGKFIVDFVCLDKKLIIELDGSQHAEQVAYDTARTLFLEKLGYRVLRFWNNEILKNLSGVLENIAYRLNL